MTHRERDHADRRARSADPEVRDEVCGMLLRTSVAAATAEFEGKTYYFCAKRCRRRFLEHPAWYVPTGQ